MESVLFSENRILTTIHQGSYWTVHKAESLYSGEQILINVLRPEWSRNDELVQAFFKSAAAIIHPNILRARRFASENGNHFIAYDFFNGISLADFLKKAGPIPEDRALAIVLQVCQATQHAHLGGVLHGGLCLETVLIDSDHQIKVVGFHLGLFWNLLMKHAATPDLMNIVNFFPPERLRDPFLITPADDAYAIGAMLFQLLTGQRAFPQSDLNHLSEAKEGLLVPIRHAVPDISPKTERLVTRILTPHPMSRLSKMVEILQEIAPLKNQTEPFEESFGKHGWIASLSKKLMIPFPFAPLFSPTLVGSRRRLAYTLFAVALMLVIIVAAALVTELSSSHKRVAKNLYSEFIAEEDSLQASQLKNRATESPAPGLRPNPLSSSDDGVGDTSKEPAGDENIKESLKGLTERLTTLQPQETSGTSIPTPPAASATEKTLSDEKVKPESQKASGAVAVTARVDSLLVIANVYVDGELVGQTKSGSDLIVSGFEAQRNHEIRIQKQGFKIWQQRIPLKSEDTTMVSAQLEPRADAFRRFTFAQVDFADRIIIDNKLPSYQLPYQADLAVGFHQLKYVDSNSLFSWETRVLLDMDSDPVVKFEPPMVGEGELTVIVSNAVQYGYAFVAIDGDRSQNRTTPYRTKLKTGKHRIQLYRDGFRCAPADTIIFVPANRQVRLVGTLFPQ